MNGFKTVKIFICVVFIAIAGCNTIDPNISTETIVSKYTDIYVQTSNIDTNTDNHDIAAMLQTITVDLIKIPTQSWKDVSNREEDYISTVKTGYISSVYTIIACPNEIRITDGFCDEIISYYSIIEEGYSSFAGNFLSEAAIRFIVNMDKYEYEKVQNNR